MFFSIFGCSQREEFEKELAVREQAAIGKLKLIRHLQELYEPQAGRYTSSFDSLKHFYDRGCFYNEETKGEIEEALSYDDYTSYAIENSGSSLSSQEALLDPVYLEIFTKLKHYLDSLEKCGSFIVSEIGVIPFTLRKIDMKVNESAKLVEVSIPYNDLLCDLNQRYVEELIASKEVEGKYPGFKFGNIEIFNGNAGNWDSQEEKDRAFKIFSGKEKAACDCLMTIHRLQNEVVQAFGKYASSPEELISLYRKKAEEDGLLVARIFEYAFEQDKHIISAHKVEIKAGKKQVPEEAKPWYEAAINYADIFQGLDTSSVREYLMDRYQDEYKGLKIGNKDSAVVYVK